MIDPFPHPGKKRTTQIPYRVETNNCDIDFSRKANTAKAASDSDTPNSVSSPQYNETMRDNVMKELLDTEENYVKLLSSICLGYGVFFILLYITSCS